MAIELPQPRRLYIRGLPAGISLEDLKKRLAAFGNVLAIDGQDKKDANGDPRRFVFVDLECTEAALHKCKTTLSGTMWKGATLKLADAKPDYRERHILEQNATSTKAEKRREKRRRLAHCDGVASNIGLATAENAASRRGWRKSVDKTDPIFPVVMRPDRPLSPPPRKKAKTVASVVTDPPRRAPRQKIDPVRWKPTHLRESQLEVDGTELPVASTSYLDSPSPSSAASSSASDFDAEDINPQELRAGSDDLRAEHEANASVANAVLAVIDAEADTSGTVEVLEEVLDRSEEPIDQTKEPPLVEAQSKTKRKPVLKPGITGTTPSASSFKAVQRYEPEDSDSSDAESVLEPLDAKAADAKFRSLFGDKSEASGGLLSGLLDEMELDEEAFPIEEEPVPTAPPRRPAPVAPANDLPPLFVTHAGTSTFRRFRLNGSVEDYIKRHEEKRPMLTAQIKKRHKEAKKRKRTHVQGS